MERAIARRGVVLKRPSARLPMPPCTRRSSPAVLRRPAAAAAAVLSRGWAVATTVAAASAAVASRGRRVARRAAATVPAPTRAALARYESRLWAEGFEVVAGTDEAGRGPLAGPVVAAAFAVLDREDKEVLALLSMVSDSKKMTKLQREKAFKELTDPKYCGRTAWAIAEASVSEIDRVNILQASLSAMDRSVRDLAVRADCVLVDGCNRPPQLLRPGETWTRGSKAGSKADAAAGAGSASSAAKGKRTATAWIPRRVDAVIKGDGKVLSIGAASVLAKVHRDRVMDTLHEAYPAYGFDTHRGYGTKAHMSALREHGACPAHRRSFAPVREVLGLGERAAKASVSPGEVAGSVGPPGERLGKALGTASGRQAVRKASPGSAAAPGSPAATEPRRKKRRQEEDQV